MPRKPRLQSAGLPVQIIQRGNNRQACFLKRMCKQVVAHLQHSPDGKTKHLLVKGDGIHEEF